MKKLAPMIVSAVAGVLAMGQALAADYELQQLEMSDKFKSNLVRLVSSYDFEKPSGISASEFYKNKQNFGMCVADKLAQDAKRLDLPLQYVHDSLDRIWEFNEVRSSRQNLDVLEMSVHLQKRCQDYHPNINGMVSQMIGLDIRKKEPGCMANQMLFFQCVKERRQKYNKQYNLE